MLSPTIKLNLRWCEDSAKMEEKEEIIEEAVGTDTGGLIETQYSPEEVVRAIEVAETT